MQIKSATTIIATQDFFQQPHYCLCWVARSEGKEANASRTTQNGKYNHVTLMTRPLKYDKAHNDGGEYLRADLDVLRMSEDLR